MTDSVVEDDSIDFGSEDDSVLTDAVVEDDSIDFGSADDRVLTDSVVEDDSIDFGSADDSVLTDSVVEDDSIDFGSEDDRVLTDSVVEDDAMKFDLPKNQSSVIKVIGVGGGGGNAVNHMINQGIRGVDFIICNTDSQALDQSDAPTKLQLGISLTEGLGAGENPVVGEQAAIESEREIRDILSKNTKMVFVTAGMGGGTGTGAAPVIAKICKELDILTIGIVTVPFGFEGPKRLKQAQDGTAKMREYVDSLIVINNDKLVEVYGDLELTSGFAKADEILMVAARSISEVITQNCTLNIDLNDAKTVLKDSGTAIMGSGRASGPNRSEEVVDKALDSPLLNDNHIRGAKKILLLILSGKNEITIKEINEINYHLQREAGGNSNIILGVGKDLSLDEDISITIIATGVLGKNVDPATGVEERKVHHLESSTNNSPTSINMEEDIEEHVKEEDLSTDNIAPENTVEFIKKGQATLESNREQKRHQRNSILNANITNDDLDNITDSNMKRAEERRKRLQKFHNLNLNNQVVLQDLEDEPAYKRQGLELDDVEHSSEEPVSRISLDSKEENIELKSNNSFLHDNVD